jgi:hypothetical protein
MLAMSKPRLLYLLTAFAFALTACAPAATPEPDPLSVIQGYAAAFNARNLDQAMSFIAADAVFVDPGGRYEGAEAIRGTLELAAAEGVTFTLDDCQNANGYVSCGYEVFVGGISVTSGQGLTVVQEGKIVFDGTQATLDAECVDNPAYTFCVAG